MKILVLDNYDSFTYNLVHYIENFADCELEVFRNDKIQMSEIEKYDKIVLSPGPGLPDEAGILKDLIREYAGKKSIFGVCLGMQAIGEVFGGSLENLDTVYHGVETKMFVKDKSEIIFKDIPEEFQAGRYHSWVVSNKNFPQSLKITAVDENGQIMALSHKEYDLKGVQFHPESILTEHGEKILKNFIEN
jgi:anthranilate synthase component 2